LLHRLRADAHILATELDPTSLTHARATVSANGASESITVVPAPEGRIFPISVSEEDAQNSEQYAFTMCNPPFFGSAQEVVASRELKAGPAPAAPTAAVNEEVTRGGEEAFVGAMIAESKGLPVRWFTSLVGRYESLHALVMAVRAVTDNYYVVSLRQARTTRWVLIWGFGRERLPDVSNEEVW
jgi:methyltransferase